MLLGRELDRYINAFGKRWGEASAFHGYVAVARDGKVAFGKGYGRSAAADGDTRFRIGSLTKPFTAIAILQLEENGLLRIDDSIRKHLPELPAFCESITIRHCLTHASGLPPIPDDPALVAETGRPHSADVIFAAYKDAAPRFKPGERFEYSNAGYSILAAILERVTGRSYEAYLREHVFWPAGMTRTTTASVRDVAVAYAITADDSLVTAPPITYVTFGAGAIVSTANDLIAFDRALSGTRLLREDTKRRMLTPERELGVLVTAPVRYGLGWMVTQSDGYGVFGHYGGVSGFETSFARVPDAKLTLVVLSNLGGSQTVVRRIAEAAQQIALTGKGPEPIDERESVPFEGALSAALEGDYALVHSDAEAMAAKLPRDAAEGVVGLTVTRTGSRLFAKLLGRSTVELFSGADGVLFAKHTGMEVLPERTASGGVIALRVSTARNAGPLVGRYVRVGSEWDDATAGTCPPGMTRVPGGKSPFDPEIAVASFCLDRSEITVAEYAKCVRRGACAPAPTAAAWSGATDAERARWSPMCNGARRDRQEHPVNCIDWNQADRFCRAQDKRLPTRAEWQWAARGGEQRRSYAWGYRPPDVQLCWSGVDTRSGTCPVGAYPASDARGGIHDLAGNVWEWTANAEQLGGAWLSRDPAQVMSIAVLPSEPAFRGPTVGFRCAK